jgi:hypothetical protein
MARANIDKAQVTRLKGHEAVQDYRLAKLDGTQLLKDIAVEAGENICYDFSLI